MESQTLDHPLMKSAAKPAEASTNQPLFRALAAPAPGTRLLARAEPTGDLYNTVIACAVEDRSSNY